MIKKNIKIAMVGAGYMADLHVQVFNAQPNVTVAGITSRTISKAQELATKYGIPLVAASTSELLNHTEFDLVVVAVPETVVKDVLIEVMEFGVPVFSEKPIGLNLSESLLVVEQAKQKNIPFWAGLNRRSYSSTQSAVKGLNEDSGSRFIQVLDQQDQKAVLDMGFDKKIVENWMYANSIHLVDYICTFGRGEISNVQVIDEWKPHKDNCVVNAKVSFTSGDMALYTAVWGCPGPWGCSVTTVNKRWDMRPLEKVTVQENGSRSITELPISKMDTDYKAGLFAQSKDVIDALINGSKTNIVPDIDEVIRVTRLVSDIYGTQ